MKKTVSTFALASLMLVASTGLSAAEPATQSDADVASSNDEKKDGKRKFISAHSKGGFVRSYDTDGDGQVSQAEFLAEREKGYNLRDADGNGTLVEEEYVGEYVVRMDKRMAERRAGGIKQAHVRFNILDGNEDKVMTLAEFHDSGSRMFSRLDSNEDGIVNDQDTAESF